MSKLQYHLYSRLLFVVILTTELLMTDEEDVLMSNDGDDVLAVDYDDGDGVYIQNEEDSSHTY